MHGAKLSREAIIAGGGHWRLHFVGNVQHLRAVPILGVLFAWWKPVNVDPMLYSGFLYLCILPATVQSAIAFTSMAGGKRRGGGLFCVSIQPAGDFPFTIAGWSGDECSRCRGQP
ncbi:bile acid:sodium symporter [Escherichia coli]|uniref:bile acid:sodium symporter n=1 Tax=Escherichia coli TaxID=562 RepID=UPI00397611A6